MKKQFFLLVAVLAMIFCIVPAHTTEAATTNQKVQAVEKQIRKRYKKVKFIKNDGSERFWSKIESRKGKPFYYVEKTIGRVINNKKDGKDINGYYISYKGVKGVKRGDKVVSYFVYSRSNNYCDDIIARYDIIIRK